MGFMNWISDNIFLFAIVVIASFFIFKYFVLPKLKRMNHLPANFDPFKNIEQYDNVSKPNEEIKDKGIQ